ncbi:MAG TPA: DUF5335 family protein [Micromonosporaceae bacterium]
MADTLVVDRIDWVSFFDRLSHDQQGKLVTIEIMETDLGDQYEVERLPFAYATYDRRDDLVMVGVGGSTPRYPVVLRHVIEHPTEVDSAGSGDWPAVRVVGADGAATLMRFYPPGG